MHCRRAIAEQQRLDLAAVSDLVDPTFRFMTLDWDGQIRTDRSSPFAMQRPIAVKDDIDKVCAESLQQARAMVDLAIGPK